MYILEVAMKRRDATLINDPDPFHSIVPYVMAKRTEAEVSSDITFDITKLNKFMAQHNKKEGTQYKLFHAICTAMAKTIYHRPKMNIFISGRKFWMRNDIILSFVIKQKMSDGATETLMTLKVDEDMNLDAISSRILNDVNRVRKESTNDLDKLMNFVGKLPRPIMEILFWVIGRMEYHGCVPQSLTEGDPNYTTCLLSNLGSIGADSCYHHLSNYGTNSIMVTIGTMYKEDKKDLVRCTFTIDERIADGFYFAKSMRLVKYLLENPDKLMEPINGDIPENLFD